LVGEVGRKRREGREGDGGVVLGEVGRKRRR